MRLTMKTNLALRVLMGCAAQSDTLLRKREIAAACNASEAHLALVIHQLGQAGFLTTLRGRHGGFRLARDASQITVGDVYRAIEPDHAITDCLGTDRLNCARADYCSLTQLMERALAAFHAVLDEMTVEQLASGNVALHEAYGLPHG